MAANPAVVIDNGSGVMKAGVAGEEAPRACFPAVVGLPKYQEIDSSDERKFYMGQDAIQKRGVLALEYPLEGGVVRNWDWMTRLWFHCYNVELKIEAEAQPVLVTEAALNPRRNREEMAEVFFERLRVPAFYVYPQAVLALYAAGRMTGLVADSGDGVTHVVAVYDGYSIRHAVSRMDVAGRSLTGFLQRHAAEDGLTLASGAERDIARHIKETRCYCAQDFEAEVREFEARGGKRVEYEMPDGQRVQLGSVVVRTPECLLQPRLLGADVPGLHRQIFDSAQRADVDLRRELLENVTLSGGSTMFPGLPERLGRELGALAPPALKVRVTAPPERKFSIWIGGSVLAALATFQASWISRAEFEEAGAAIVHRKCY